MKYYLINPSGNITVLIEGKQNKELADAVMKKEPTCEQVGFISRDKADCDIYLCMAGGEFCGNATMSAAYLTGKSKVKVFVEGTGDVEVLFEGNTGSVKMPKPLEITTHKGYPLVRFPGIDHMIIEGDIENPETLIKEYCISEALGMMFINGEKLKPLVYVKSIDTLFWESSCASGTTAAGEYYNRPCRFVEPGGILQYNNGYLIGNVEIIKEDII